MFFVFRDSYVLCIYVTNIMNVLRTGMNMSISRIHIWLIFTMGTLDCAMFSKLGKQTFTNEFKSHWLPDSYGLTAHQVINFHISAFDFSADNRLTILIYTFPSLSLSLSLYLSIYLSSVSVWG